MKKNMIHFFSIKSNIIVDLLERSPLKIFLLEISSGFINEEYFHSSLFCQIKSDCKSPREKSSEDLLFRDFFWMNLTSFLMKYTIIHLISDKSNRI